MKERRIFNQEEIQLINRLIKEIPADTRKAFESTFKAWKSGWMKGSLASVSDPYARAKTGEFRELKAMGKTIVPLVVSKLMDETNFLALSLFEALADKKMMIRIDATDEKVLEGEQGRAYRTVKNYLGSI